MSKSRRRAASCSSSESDYDEWSFAYPLLPPYPVLCFMPFYDACITDSRESKLSMPAGSGRLRHRLKIAPGIRQVVGGHAQRLSQALCALLVPQARSSLACRQSPARLATNKYGIWGLKIVSLLVSFLFLFCFLSFPLPSETSQNPTRKFEKTYTEKNIIGHCY